MPSCDGAEALERCWYLGDKGDACSSVCGAVERVDATATEALASSEPVAVALTLRYGLPPWRAATLGARCDDHGAWQSSAFLWLGEAQVWGCFPGESLTHVSPVFRAPCACVAAAAPWWRVCGGELHSCVSPATLGAVLLAAGLLLLAACLYTWSGLGVGLGLGLG